MYRLFQRIPRGLDPVAEIFRRHVESEGMKLVKEVTDAMQSKKEKDAGARPARLPALHGITQSVTGHRQLVLLLPARFLGNDSSPVHV